jgi:hypothetical protein
MVSRRCCKTILNGTTFKNFWLNEGKYPGIAYHILLVHFLNRKNLQKIYFFAGFLF